MTDQVKTCEQCAVLGSPDPIAHPGGQAEHVHGVDRVGGRRTLAQGVVITRYEATNVVEQAPEQTLIMLELLANADPKVVFVSGAIVYIGNDRDGAEVAYRVVGWDANHGALVAHRVPDRMAAGT